MNTVVAFAGQGSEHPRMGLEVARAHPPAARLWRVASEITGVDLFDVVARGRPELEQTSVLQPALVAVSLGLWSWLTSTRGLDDAIVVGHSLGELSAWCASGEIGPEDAIALAHRRGAAMEAEARGAAGGMSACRVPRERWREVEADARRAGVDVGAYNAPDEIVLTGPKDALGALQRRWSGRRLDVSGPWHASTMAPAAARFLQAATEIRRAPRRRRWLSSASADFVGRDPARELADQMTRPVRWLETIERLLALRVERFLVVAPGRPLASLIRRCAGDLAVPIRRVEVPADIAELACFS